MYLSVMSIEDEIAEEFGLLTSNDLEDAKSIGIVYQTLQSGKDYSKRDFTIKKFSEGRPFNVKKVAELQEFSTLILKDKCIIKSCIDVNVTLRTGLRWISSLEGECEKRKIPFFINWDKHAPYGKTKTTIRKNPYVRSANRLLNENQVRIIKETLNEGGVSFHNISLLVGCSPSTVYSILNGFSWDYVLPFTYRQVEIAMRRIELSTANKLDHEIAGMKY